jgi:predicted dehydrogenase
MNRGNLSRRGFLRRSLAGMVAAGLPVWYAREVVAANDEKDAGKKPAGPSDEIVMGAIGIGSPQSRGRAIYGDAKRHKGVRYVALCDVDLAHRRNALNMMRNDGFTDAVSYKDFRELLDRKDINAVTIATPDHWHALVALEAMRKGKDVYCEKPLTLTIDEGKALVKAARETGRVFQVGSQQRSDARFRLACELVRNGRIGKVTRVETRIGENPQSPPLPKAPPPEGLDWDFWLGPTPVVDYVELPRAGNMDPMSRCHYDFRWWYDYSGGKMTDWGAHHNDIAQWGLGMDGNGPVAVEAKGTEPAHESNRYNCHHQFEVTYTYADGAKLVCTSGGENGVKFEGEDGKWIFVSRGRIDASDKKLLDESLPSDAVKLYVSHDHMGNFLECVKSRKKPICDVEVGHRSVTVCHIGAIALRTGKKLKWSPAEEAFVGDEQANKWLRREMRSPWKLEV